MSAASLTMSLVWNNKSSKCVCYSVCQPWQQSFSCPGFSTSHSAAEFTSWDLLPWGLLPRVNSHPVSSALSLPFCRAEFLHTITFLQPEKSSFNIFCRTDLIVVNSHLFILKYFPTCFHLGGLLFWIDDSQVTAFSLQHFIHVALPSALHCLW